MTGVRGARNWLEPIARSIVAIAIAIVVTFSADHSPPIGYLTIGVFAVLSGIVLCVASALLRKRGRTWWLFETQGAVLTIVGIVSLLSVERGLPFLLALSSAAFVATGLLELIAGLAQAGPRNARTSQTRDWIFAGALTVIFGLAVLLIPANFSQQFTGPDGVERALTASVILVGAFGAYATILGVYLVIAGLSLKWSATASTAAKES